jgi:hypothetical protein
MVLLKNIYLCKDFLETVIVIKNALILIVGSILSE